jgi:cob(I)alamin adenosyltransferase
MSIATRRGDGGETGLGGGDRISKANARVETYGAIDELDATIGLARAHCNDAEIRASVRDIRCQLFVVGSAISTKPESSKPVPQVTKDMLHRLDALVERFEEEPGILRDWSIPGECAESAAFDLARTVCRRAERGAVRYVTNGGIV